MGRYFGNPLAIGIPGGVSSGQTLWYNSSLGFGQPIYNTATITVTTPTTNPYGTVTISTGGRPVGLTSIGVRRTPAYITVVAFEYRRRTPEQVRTDLMAILARSSRIPSRNNVRITMSGRTVILRGRVATARERRRVEGVIRLTPGVRAVRNELTVASTRRRTRSP
jgi:hypothetical protein